MEFDRKELRKISGSVKKKFLKIARVLNCIYTDNSLIAFGDGGLFSGTKKKY